MENKKINARLVSKHDIEANWLKAKNFIPLNGEFIIYNKEKEGDELPAGRTQYITYDRLKIGDGVLNPETGLIEGTSVNNLPFVITETECVGRKTEEGGLIFNDYENNLALGENCVAMGAGCAAGARGYYYQSIDTVNKKIYLATELVERTIEVLDKTERELWEESGIDFFPYQGSLKDDGTYDLYTVEFTKTNPGQKYNVYKQDGTYVGYFTFSEPRYDDIECGDVLDVITDVPYLAGYSMPGGPANFSQCGYGEPYEFRAVLSSTTTSGPIISTDDFTDASFETPAYEIGDQFNIINFSHYILCGEITDIQNNVISYKDDLPFTEIKEDIDDDAYTFWVPTKPEIGIALPFDYATAGGSDSKATGSWSTAFGYHNIAADNFATAFGNNNIAGYSAFTAGKTNKALGYHSTALGYETDASGKSSFTTGYRTKSKGEQAFSSGAYNEANGNNSFAGGYKSKANGEAAVALGTENTVDGKNATAFGTKNNVSGENAFAAGHRSTASGKNSFAFGGDYAKATGDNSVVIGGNAGATNAHSIAMGKSANANADYSVAIGNSAVTTGESAAAIGFGAKGNGIGSVALGGYSNANGKYAIAGGDHTTANGQGSVALGHYTTATGTGAISAGVYTNANGAGQVVVGKYNEANNKAFFIVGNGNSTTRKNALVVYDNGSTEVQTQGTTDNSVIIKKTFDTKVEELNNKNTLINKSISKLESDISLLNNDTAAMQVQLTSLETEIYNLPSISDVTALTAWELISETSMEPILGPSMFSDEFWQEAFPDWETSASEWCYIRHNDTTDIWSGSVSDFNPVESEWYVYQNGEYVGDMSLGDERYYEEYGCTAMRIITNVPYLSGFGGPGIGIEFFECGKGNEHYDFRRIIQSVPDDIASIQNSFDNNYKNICAMINIPYDSRYTDKAYLGIYSNDKQLFNMDNSLKPAAKQGEYLNVRIIGQVVDNNIFFELNHSVADSTDSANGSSNIRESTLVNIGQNYINNIKINIKNMIFTPGTQIKMFGVKA